MKRDLVLALLTCGAFFIAGCGTISRTTTVTVTISEQERAFAGALEFLRMGDERNAREQLERVVAEAPIAGITEEALFRLALLCLRDEGGRGGGRAAALLEQLRKQYPTSIWAHQAAPIQSYMTSRPAIRDHQRELKALREQNLSLNRENRELRQTIERLKSLDLELEQRIKR